MQCKHILKVNTIIISLKMYLYNTLMFSFAIISTICKNKDNCVWHYFPTNKQM